MKNQLLTFALLLCALVASGQTAFDWNLDFYSVFDNREGDGDHTAAETISLTRLSPEVGFRLGASDRIAGGIVWTQPIAYDWNGTRVRPTIYYSHSSSEWSGAFGIFPRRQLMEEQPSFMWCDSLDYFQPNIRGALLQWHRGGSFAEIYLDWRQAQTETKRESFSIAAHGRWAADKGPWMAGAYLTMNHLALTKNAPEDMHIVDNFLAAPYVGADFSRCTALDSLRVRVGAVTTIERNRAYGKWETPVGGWLEVIAGWKGFELKNTLYVGDTLMPSYQMFGAELYQGEPFYSSDFYNRTDVSYGIVRRSGVELRAHLDFNFSPDSFIFYQRITLRFNFDGSLALKKRI